VKRVALLAGLVGALVLGPGGASILSASGAPPHCNPHFPCPVTPPPPPAGQWWSASSPWNTLLTGNETLDSARTSAIQALGPYTISWVRYGVALYEVTDPATPRYTVRHTAFNLNLPGVPIPPSVYPAGGSDAHLSILDSIPGSPTQGCVFDFWHAGTVGGDGTLFDYSNPRGEFVQRERIFEESGFIQGASTRGASDANLGGILTSQELAAGQINHAIAMYVPDVAADTGHPWLPSYTSGGTSSTSLLGESMHVRIDPAWNPSGLPAWQLLIVRALQGYGGYIIDGGGADIPAIDNSHSGYGPAYPWGSTTYPQLDASITQHMQVLTPGATSTETYDPIMSHPCGDFAP
jgi:hypothetical protein